LLAIDWTLLSSPGIPRVAAGTRPVPVAGETYPAEETSWREDEHDSELRAIIVLQFN